MAKTHRLSVAHLTAFARRLFEAAGTPPAMAQVVAEILVRSNLTGHDSHGILRIPAYLEQIEGGSLVPDAEPVALRETPATVLLDGRRGWGHYVAREAMRLAMERARQMGIGAVSILRCNHIGRLGEYVEQAAAAGFIGLVTQGAGGPGVGCAAPPGGRERSLGTNPLALGFPTGDRTPFVLDFATTVIAEGKIQVARSKGMALPEGAIVDAEGRPSTHPADFYAGGSIRFAGGHKGYALSLANCLLGGLAGSFNPERGRMGGVFVQAVDPGAFMDRDEYPRQVRAFLNRIKAGPTRPGEEILIPGEPERRALAERSEQGIEVPDTIWSQIVACAGKLGVDLTGQA